jgi:hypothetical protein
MDEPHDWNTVTRMIYQEIMGYQSGRTKDPEVLKNEQTI